MQSSSDPLKFSILYTLTALANPTGKVIDPKYYDSSFFGSTSIRVGMKRLTKAAFLERYLR